MLACTIDERQHMPCFRQLNYLERSCDSIHISNVNGCKTCSTIVYNKTANPLSCASTPRLINRCPPRSRASFRLLTPNRHAVAARTCNVATGNHAITLVWYYEYAAVLRWSHDKCHVVNYALTIGYTVAHVQVTLDSLNLFECESYTTIPSCTCEKGFIVRYVSECKMYKIINE